MRIDAARSGFVYVGLALVGLRLGGRGRSRGLRATTVFGQRFAREEDFVFGRRWRGMTRALTIAIVGAVFATVVMAATLAAITAIVTAAVAAAILIIAAIFVVASVLVIAPIVAVTGTLRIAALRGGVFRGRKIASALTALMASATPASAAAPPSATATAITAAVIAAIFVSAAIVAAAATAIVALRVALRGVVMRRKILRSTGVGFGLALVLLGDFLVSRARRGVGSLNVADVVVLIGFVHSFNLMLLFFAGRFGNLVRRAFAVRVRSIFAGNASERLARQKLNCGLAEFRRRRYSRTVGVLFAVTVMTVIVIFKIFENVRDVEESIAIEANVNERRLHAGEDASNAALVDAAD